MGYDYPIYAKKGYHIWKIAKVTNFYKALTPIVIKQCLIKGAPPGAILSIASLESGYGTGYIANVSGNILSLNAKKSEPMLPPLTVPITKDNKIIIDNIKLKKMLASGYPFNVKDRPPSLKKDYRPYFIAGTKSALDYFLNNPKEKFLAWENNINDLLFKKLKSKTYVKAYIETNDFCFQLKAEKSILSLLKNSSSEKFINLIGGKPLSFNIHKSWKDKCVLIIYKIGIEQFLTEYLKVYKNHYDLKDWVYDI